MASAICFLPSYFSILSPKADFKAMNATDNCSSLGCCVVIYCNQMPGFVSTLRTKFPESWADSLRISYPNPETRGIKIICVIILL